MSDILELLFVINTKDPQKLKEVQTYLTGVAGVTTLASAGVSKLSSTLQGASTHATQAAAAQNAYNKSVAEGVSGQAASTAQVTANTTAVRAQATALNQTAQATKPVSQGLSDIAGATSAANAAFGAYNKTVSSGATGQHAGAAAIQAHAAALNQAGQAAKPISQGFTGVAAATSGASAGVSRLGATFRGTSAYAAQAANAVNTYGKSVTAGAVGTAANTAALHANTAAINAHNAALAHSASAHSTVSRGMIGTFAAADLLARGIERISYAVRDGIQDVILYAARTQQLATISSSLASINGLNTRSVQQNVQAIRELGITAQQSYNLVTRVIQIRQNVEVAPQLARIAQDAAKIGGISPSEALENIVTGITTARVQNLHSVGLLVSFQQAYREYAAKIHTTTAALTQNQEAEARLQAVLKSGVSIQGAYDSSLTTAAGQIQLTKMYVNELKDAIGNGLQPVLFEGVTVLNHLAKAALDNTQGFQDLTAATLAFTVAGAVFAATSFIPHPGARLGVAAAAGAATYIGADQDVRESGIKQARFALEEQADNRRRLQRQADLGVPGAKVLLEQQNKIGVPKLQSLIVNDSLDTYANQTIKREKALGPVGRKVVAVADGLDASHVVGAGAIHTLTDRIFGRSPAIPENIQLASGIQVTRSQVQQRIKELSDPNYAGGKTTPDPLENEEQSAKFDQFIKTHGKSLRGQLNQSRLAFLTGLDKILADAKAANAELTEEINENGFTDKQKSSPQVAQLRGLIVARSRLLRDKYLQDRAVTFAKDDAELADALAGASQTGKSKQQNLTSGADLKETYNRHIANAQRILGINKNQDQFSESLQAANRELLVGKSKLGTQNEEADTTEQIQGIKRKSELDIRLRSIGAQGGKPGGETANIAADYQTRVQAASEEYQLTGNIRTLRSDIATAWNQKIEATAQFEEKKLQEQKQQRLQEIGASGQFQEKVAQLKNDPRDQFNPINDIYALRLRLAQQTLEVTGKTWDYQQAILAAERERIVSVLELQRKELTDFGNQADHIFDALTSKNGGVALKNYFMGQVLTIGRTVFRNFAMEEFKGAQSLGIDTIIKGQTEIQRDSTGAPVLNADGTPKKQLSRMGRLLAGTPAGIDQKKLINPSEMQKMLAGSTDKNTRATDDNTDALKNLTDALLHIGPGKLSSAGGPLGSVLLTGGGTGPGFPLPFGSGFPGSVSPGGTFSTDSRLLGFSPLEATQSTNSANGAFSLFPSPGLFGGIGGTPVGGGANGDFGVSSASDIGGVTGSGETPTESMGLPAGRVDNSSGESGPAGGGGPLAGSVEGPLFNPDASTGSQIASGVGTAGVVYGGYRGISTGIRQGGAYGTFGAISSAAATAAALDPEPISKGALEIAAVVSKGIQMIIGDPKQQFADKQAKLLRNNRQFDPDQISVTSDLNGNLSDYNFKGQSRSSGFNAYGFNDYQSHYDRSYNKYQVVPGRVDPVYQPTPAAPITVQVQTLDAKSFDDNKNMIATAVNNAVVQSGHPLGLTMANIAQNGV